jgi:3-oxoacyl-[acyl-carrier protein] reductase
VAPGGTGDQVRADLGPGRRLLDGQVALITGSGSGQGRAAARLFARHGARIVVAEINASSAAETVALVEQDGGKALPVVVDVARRPDCDALVEAAMDAFGRLDVLYNNAAVQMSGRIVDCTVEQWDLTIATNLSAVFWACRAAIPHMLAGGGGRIINTASTLGLIGSPGFAAYGPAKAGLVALTRQIATEYGPAIRANVVAPGSIDTPRFRKVAERMPPDFVSGLESRIPMRRLGTAEDIAGTALYLASELSDYVSGNVIGVDGGLAAVR